MMELTIEHLSKRYGQHWALRELSLRCEPGMLGLVGPNGIGSDVKGDTLTVCDVNGDGRPDFLYGAGTGLLVLNTPKGFVLREDSGIAYKPGKVGPVFGDFDNDGHPDLVVPQHNGVKLFRNDGKGRFTDVTAKTGDLARFNGWATSAAWGDVDNDGHLDLVIGCLKAPNRFYRNKGDGTFEDVSKKSHIDQADGHYSLSVSTLDYDDDGWPDIFVACDSTASILYHNNRDGTFTDVAITAGAAFNEDGRAQAGMGSTVADYNGDGKLDIFKTNFSDDTATLYRNNGNGTFDDATYPAGLGLNTKYLGWGAMFFDFDNDGWPDLLLVNGHVYPEVDSQHLGSTFQEPRILYHNNGNSTFTDISADAGPGITSLNSSRGLAIGDLWNDGRLSAVISNMNSPPSLLVNDVRTTNHWIAFHLISKSDVRQPHGNSSTPQAQGSASFPPLAKSFTSSTSSTSFTSFVSSRDAIGARVTMKTGSRFFVDEVRSGSSYDSNSDMRIHFGLGSATKLDSVQVRWPSGLVERFENLAVDTIHTLKESTGILVKPPQK